jgi:hypothetical protein
MKNILAVVLSLLSCNPENRNKIPVYAWESGPGNKSDTELLSEFKNLKNNDIDGLMYNVTGISTPPSNLPPVFYCEAKTSLVRQSKECR